LFINDLPPRLSTIPGIDPHIPDLNGRLIHHLLFADDLILFSKSAEGLQKMLNQLEIFCGTWKLEVNIKKTTKDMKIGGNGHMCKDLFLFNGVPIENCSSYKYLGVVLSSSGSFTNSKLNASNKAKKALFKIRSYLRNVGVNPRIGRAQSLHFGEGVFGSHSADFGSTSDNCGSKYLLW
jgi:hypothetical protein